MAGQTVPVAASVVLDSTGAGTLYLAPRGNMDWVVTRTAVVTSTATKVPTANLYRNTVNQANFIEGSYTGSNDSSDTRIVFGPGEQLVCAWAGGDVGATATCTVTAILYPPGTAPRE